MVHRTPFVVTRHRIVVKMSIARFLYTPPRRRTKMSPEPMNRQCALSTTRARARPSFAVFSLRTRTSRGLRRRTDGVPPTGPDGFAFSGNVLCRAARAPQTRRHSLRPTRSFGPAPLPIEFAREPIPVATSVGQRGNRRARAGLPLPDNGFVYRHRSPTAGHYAFLVRRLYNISFTFRRSVTFPRSLSRSGPSTPNF